MNYYQKDYREAEAELIIDECTKKRKVAQLYLQKNRALERLQAQQRRMNKKMENRKKYTEIKYRKKAQRVIEGKTTADLIKPVLDKVFTFEIMLIIIISLSLFFGFSKWATIQRGYRALGGEGILLLIPVAAIIYRTGNVLQEMNK